MQQIVVDAVVSERLVCVQTAPGIRSPLTSLLLVKLASIDLRILIGQHARQDLQEVCFPVGGVCAGDEALHGVVFTGAAAKNAHAHSRWMVVSQRSRCLLRRLTYLSISGSHCTVSDGHSSACVTTKSYSIGEFFFQILYSSFTVFSSSCKASDHKHGWICAHILRVLDKQMRAN